MRGSIKSFRKEGREKFQEKKPKRPRDQSTGENSELKGID